MYDTAPWNSTSSTGFRNKLEGWGIGRGNDAWRNHNRVHRWVGGHMLGGASVNDPVFWLHHAFVDLLWSRWQKRHRGARYLPAWPPELGRRAARAGRGAARGDAAVGRDAGRAGGPQPDLPVRVSVRWYR